VIIKRDGNEMSCNVISIANRVSRYKMGTQDASILNGHIEVRQTRVYSAFATPLCLGGNAWMIGIAIHDFKILATYLYQ
jgi:hypothetical protein